MLLEHINSRVLYDPNLTGVTSKKRKENLFFSNSTVGGNWSRRRDYIRDDDGNRGDSFNIFLAVSFLLIKNVIPPMST